ncbi:hypothetical protein VB796_19445 [Arcicella sp. LKC2W]|uniref:hypothetical protein n=1 Tax=Arcicella sp. LKC2W TaxID=2984198 RepID=UPI002B1F8E56|nr:hypothetical protein [Arcicella sp. LKC2W]MEA5461247.1 hypothetical protein [Arcicella sp. LKC2W]
MRKIDKTTILSTAYKNWEESLSEHPEYNSSKNKFYYDVVMNLFHCQQGLCAYTEQLLCISTFYDGQNWKDGIYQKPQNWSVKGQLEHFDSTQKKTKGWLWDNFFMADTDVNTKIKRTKPVNNILKFDHPNYNEFELLEYDSQRHIFIANTDLEEAVQEQINEMLFTLGVNHEPVRTVREDYLEYKIRAILNLINTWENINIIQFPTAFEFCKREILASS